MSRYCLDTSAYSHFRRAEAGVVEVISSAEWIGLPAVVIGELESGFLRGARTAENRAALAEFMADPLVEELVVDRRVARIFAEILVALRAAGKPLPINDVWVAATAARAGATLVTYDAHFRAVERVGCVVLEPTFGV